MNFGGQGQWPQRPGQINTQGLLQAIEQFKQQQMFKSQLLQMFGLSPVTEQGPNPMGYLPPDRPAMIIDNQTYTSMNPINQQDQGLLKALLGIQGQRMGKPFGEFYGNFGGQGQPQLGGQSQQQTQAPGIEQLLALLLQGR